MISPSAFSNFSAAAFTSSSNAHFPVFEHVPQAMQPRIAFAPSWIVSCSIPSLLKMLVISLIAMDVFPFSLGLPFIISVFIMVYATY